MKLAEALLLRADLQTRLARVRERIAKNALQQQGDKPAEDPEALLREASGIIKDLTRLIVGINRANIRAKVPDGRSIMEAIGERDALKQQHALLMGAIAATHKEPERYSAREIKWIARLSVAKIQKQADDVAGKLRELNARIQEVNWKTEFARGEG